MSAMTAQRLEGTQDANSLELFRLIRGLQSLVDGPSYINQLVAYGPKAIPALADVLLHGRPSSIPQPRQWTVEALGGLAAYDVLLSYLRRPLKIRSAIVLKGEEAVQNSAARELSAHRSEEAYTVLLDCLRRRPLPGVVETIGRYGRIEPAPYLVDCLEDDICRASAQDALQALNDAVRPLLVESALIRKPPSPDPESPSSIRRRRSCVRLLESLPLEKEDVERLAALLNEKNPDLVTSVAKVLFNSPHFRDYHRMLAQLKRVQRTVGWWLQDEFKSLAAQIERKVSQLG